MYLDHLQQFIHGGLPDPEAALDQYQQQLPQLGLPNPELSLQQPPTLASKFPAPWI
jgi:hypothetical protein